MRTPTRDQLAELEQFAENLRSQPRQWQPYPHTKPSPGASKACASRIRNGRYRTFGPGFEARADGRTLLVRYTGEPHTRYSRQAAA